MGKCDESCFLPTREDCAAKGFPPGCYFHKEDAETEAEKNAINDALGGFDNYALGYRVPNR